VSGSDPQGAPSGRGRAFLWAMIAAALAWRLVLAAWTPVPAEDGVSYLWMAERFATGDFVTPLEEVFPPLLPLLAAVPIALGVEPFFAGQLTLAVAGAAAAWTSAHAVERVVPGGGPGAACLLAFAPLPARYAAEVYTEPLFLCLAGAVLACALRERPAWWLAGLWAGLAFWVRPEAVVFPAAFALARGRRSWPVAVVVALAIALLTLWRGLATGGDFHPLPKLQFNAARGLEESGRWGHNLLRMPRATVEAFGPLLLLAIVGTVRRRRHGFGLLGVVLAVAVVPIVTFAVRRRFVVSWTVALLPLAVAGLRGFPRRWQGWLLVAFVVYGVFGAWRGLTADDRIAEREVGEWLAAQLEPGERVAGDMTRLLWFAGQRPLPPRHFDADEHVAMAREPGVRFAVFSSRREETWPAVRDGLGGWTEVPVPERMRAAARSRGLVVLRRRE